MMDTLFDQDKQGFKARHIGEMFVEKTFMDKTLVDLIKYDNAIRLDSSLKNQFEQAFGVDFSNVIIHTGPFAEEITRRKNAEALTIGRDIYFASGKYSPDTDEGIKLLAHELQHFIQREERHVYYEDIMEAEHKAEKAEESIQERLIPDITDTIPAPQGPVPVLFQNTSISQTEKIKKFPLSKTAGGMGDNIDDFMERRDKPLFEIILKDGTSVCLTNGEMDLLYNEFEGNVIEWLRDQKNGNSEIEYEQRLMDFVKIF